jgi:YggT family protein
MGSIFDLLAAAINFYTIILLIRVLITWVPNIDPYNPFVRVLFQVTDPVLEPARRLIPAIGMVDISPIVVFFVLRILADILRSLG